MKKENNIKKYISLFLLFLIITLIFYGRIFSTWFQQDEWSILGNSFYYNSFGKIRGVKSFLVHLFPEPRDSYSPLSFTLFAVIAHFFKTNFNY